MFNSPFLQEALSSRNQRQQLDHLLRITAPHERFILAGIGLVLLALVVWALFGGVVRAVSFDGVLIEPGARHEPVTAEPGQLLEILASPGDRVRAGELIARQSVPVLDREISALRGRVELLERENSQTGGGGGALRPLLDSARVALLQMEATRSARESIISQTGGEVMALLVDSGEYLPAGAAVAQLREVEEQPLQAVLRVAPSMAQRIQPGMLAVVEVISPGGVAHSLSGEVAAVSSGPAQTWLAELWKTSAEAGNQVDVVLHQVPELSIPDGSPCRIRIILGRYPPASLLIPGWS